MFILFWTCFSFAGGEPASQKNRQIEPDNVSHFLQKYNGAIQNYIMTGHERGWRQCDIMAANTLPFDDVPQITMDLDRIKTLNHLQSAFSSSNCLLVTYDVSSNGSLSTLLDFGWEVIQYVRLAMVIKLSSGMTLDTMATKTLPYLVATVSNNGKEQFLCPVIGEYEPRLEKVICKPSFVSFKHKTLRIAMMGIVPDFMMTKNGALDGKNMKLLRMLEKRLLFEPEITVANSFIDARNRVSNNYFSSM